MLYKGVHIKPYLGEFHPHGRHRTIRWPKQPEPVIKSKFVSATAVRYINQRMNSSPYTLSTTYSSALNQANSFVGVTNPWWKYQVSHCLPATTTASGELWDYDQAWITAEKHMYNTSTRTQYDLEWWGRVDLPIGSMPVPSDSLKSKVDDRAIANFLTQLDSALSSVELGQDLGEYKETVHGVTRPLQSLRHHVLDYFDQVTKLRRSFKSPSPGALKALADTYLEWTFGWKPLASDVADAIVGLQNKARHFNRVPIHAKAKEYFFGQSSITGVQNDSYSFLNLTSKTRSQHSYKVRYKGVVNTELTRDGSIPANEVLQIDLPHFVPTVWDLIPYSFIVDYFTNAGDCIRSYCARTNQIAFCVRTDRTVYDFQTNHELIDSGLQHGPPWVPGAYRGDSQRSYVTRTLFHRSNYPPSLLHPAFHFTMPDIGEKPWLNIAAILAGRMRALSPLFK